jgi:hypothetical protein
MCRKPLNKKFNLKYKILISKYFFYPNVLFNLRIIEKYQKLHRFYLVRACAFLFCALVWLTAVNHGLRSGVLLGIVLTIGLMLTGTVTKLNFAVFVLISLSAALFCYVSIT